MMTAQIVIAGDSAGGNLALALLSHVSHKNPHVPLITLEQPLGGLVLISPWVTLDQTAQSFVTNQHKDMLTAKALEIWANAFTGGSFLDSNPYIEPVKAPEKWWKSICASKILITAGEDELFVDDIKAFAKALTSDLGQQGAHIVTTVVSTNSAHDQPLTDYMFGVKQPGDQTVAFKTLLVNLLGNVTGSAQG